MSTEGTKKRYKNINLLLQLEKYLEVNADTYFDADYKKGLIKFKNNYDVFKISIIQNTVT